MFKTLFKFVAVAALLIQFIPVNRSNPAVVGDIDAPEPVATILRRSCYDCHSNQTNWPWYSYVAPVSWWVADHVREGREHLNFSRWSEYPAEERAELLEESIEEVQEGKMPLPSYLWSHRGARLNADEIAALRDWAGSHAQRHDD